MVEKVETEPKIDIDRGNIKDINLKSIMEILCCK